MSTIALGTFIAPPAGVGSTFNPRDNHGKPIIAIPVKIIKDFRSKDFPEPKDVLSYHVIDLSPILRDPHNGVADIRPNVITGSGAIMDRLARYLPGGSDNPTADLMPMPVKLVPVKNYYSVESLEGVELNLAIAWDQKFNSLAAAAAKLAEMEASAGNGATAQSNGLPAWAQNAGNGTTAAPLTTMADPATTAPANAAPAEAAPAANAYAGSSEQDLAAAIAALQK